MPFYQSSNIRLHYICRGGVPGDSLHPVMIFQHGIGGDVRQPSRFLDPKRTGVPEEKLSLIHADFRGHGQSELGPIEALSIETLARDLGALLDYLGIQHATIGGISMGAAAALRLAVHRPECCRALVLSRPAWVDGPMSASARQALALIAELLSAEDWRLSAARALEQSEILRSIDDICSDAAKSIRGHVQSALEHPERRASAIACLRRLPFSKALGDLHRDLAVVRCPTLILAAEGDPIHPFGYARQIAQCLPNSRLVQIAPKSPRAEARHLQEVDQIIGEFLRTQLALDAEMTERETLIFN